MTTISYITYENIYIYIERERERERERESIYLPKHKYYVIIQYHTGGLPKKQSLINAGRP